MAFLKGLFSKKNNNFPSFVFVYIKIIHLAKSLTFQETDVGPARKMWQGVYYYLSYAVLFQFLPVGRPVIQRYYSRNAPFPKPKQSSLIRDDKLQGHRSSSGSPDYHWVKINIDWAFDIRVREWKIRSTVHNKAASILLPDDFPQTPAVYARDLHFDLLDLFLLPKKFNWLLLNTGERSARASAYISSKGIPADQFYVNGTSGARRHEPYMDTGAARWQENTPTALTRLCDSSRGPCKHDTAITTAVSLIQPLLTECPLPAPTPVLSLFSGSTSCSVTIERTQRQTL